MIGQPEYGKGTDDQQDQAAALTSAVELGVSQTTDDGGVTGDDEGQGRQAAHDGLKHVLEYLVTHAAPVVRDAKSQGDIVWKCLLKIAAVEGHRQCQDERNHPDSQQEEQQGTLGSHSLRHKRPCDSHPAVHAHKADEVDGHVHVHI